MSNQQLTVEQAIQNITAVVDNFQGTKQQHIALEHSMHVIKEACAPKTAPKTAEKPLKAAK